MLENTNIEELVEGKEKGPKNACKVQMESLRG